MVGEDRATVKKRAGGHDHGDQDTRAPAGGDPSGVHAYDMAEASWQDAGKVGIRQKIVHADHERGRYLGLIGFEPMRRPACTSIWALPSAIS